MNKSTVKATVPKPAANGREATQFKVGNPGPRGLKRKGRGKGRKKVPLLLRDMKAVYGQDESKDRGPGQKVCRKVLTENPKEFLAQLAGLEKAHWTEKERMGPEPADPEEPEKVDEGTERVLELCDNILAEIEQELAKEDAELAARPNAAEFAATLQNGLKRALEREERLRKRVKELEAQLGS